jgi:Rap1a immunity proteins
MPWKHRGLGVAVTLVWAMASVAPCRAQDGNQLLRACTDALRYIDNGHQGTSIDDVVNSRWCLGYVGGLVDGYQWGSPPATTEGGLPHLSGLCLPPQGIPVEQLIRIVVQYLREHPRQLQAPRDRLAVVALRSAFSCLAPGALPPEPTLSGVSSPPAPNPSKGR